MDNATYILFFNIWAILLALFLMRAYQSRSLRFNMRLSTIRWHNRAVVWKNRFRTHIFHILRAIPNLFDTNPPTPNFRLLRRGRGQVVWGALFYLLCCWMDLHSSQAYSGLRLGRLLLFVVSLWLLDEARIQWTRRRNRRLQGKGDPSTPFAAAEQPPSPARTETNKLAEKDHV